MSTFTHGPCLRLRIAVVLLPAALGTAHGAPLATTDPVKAVSRPGPIERGEDAEAAKVVGKPAPGLPDLRWLDGRTRNLDSLKGHVVVIRNFTNECPFCASTIPALERLQRRYADRGVIVLGVYHPKPPSPTASEDVATFVRSLGVTFPVAVDEDWKVYHRWWKDFADGGWTSITWVLDAKGTIRYAHPGGEYHDGGGADHGACRTDFRRIETLVETLVSERRAASGN